MESSRSYHGTQIWLTATHTDFACTNRVYTTWLKFINEHLKLIPNYKFEFRENLSTIDEVHRITTVIEEAQREKSLFYRFSGCRTGF